ncbi:MAG: MalY/PatB family protein [Lactobacillus sp.]
MKYDFEHAPQRRGTDSVKWWDAKTHDLPMTIADMEFKTAPEIVAAMQKKVAFGAFGYEWFQDDYYQAIMDWFQQEHQLTLKKDWLLFVTGVVPAISSIVRRLTNQGDKVLVQEPVYDVFYHSIENNGRRTLSNPLHYEHHRYAIDWADLAQKLADPLTRLMIFCNPHNPTGQLWSKQEVQKVADLCQQNHVVLLADEIHGDLVRAGSYNTAVSVTGSAQDNVIVLTSPSKTFNVAALHAATDIIPNRNLYEIVSRGINNDELAEPNLLAVPASIAAYTEGAAWLHALLDQIRTNFAWVDHYLRQELPQVVDVSGPATYLMWLDVSQVCADSAQLAAFIYEKTGLRITAGSVYRGNGEQFIRINLAAPLAMVQDGLRRFVKGVKMFTELNRG